MAKITVVRTEVREDEGTGGKSNAEPEKYHELMGAVAAAIIFLLWFFL